MVYTLSQKTSVEWLITEKCNYKCEYCGLYNNDKQEVTNLNEIYKFLLKIKILCNKQNVRFFIFGGEPTLHPKFTEIINLVNKVNIDYLIQTNLSNHSVKILNNSNAKAIRISAHTTQVKVENLIKNVKKLNKKIEAIDVMCYNENSVIFYRELSKNIKNVNIVMTPLSNFLVETCSNSITFYNKIRNNDEYKDIIFEDERIYVDNLKGKFLNKIVERSILWEAFENKEQLIQNQPCILNNNFYLFDSQLKLFNCCFHDTHNGTCKYTKCFCG